MFTQTINSILPSLNNISVQEITLPKSALKINSLVDISIIDKTQSVYRILAGGKVFETKLPVPLNAGESFIAVVANNNPTIFRLNNLFSNFPDNKVMAEILSRLNLPVNNQLKNILRTIIEHDRPIIKSKLKKLIDIINKSESELDNSSIDLFAQLIWSSESFDEFDPEDLQHFVYSNENLSQRILNELIRQYETNPDSGFFSSLKNWLVIEPDIIVNEPALLINLIKHFESSLSEWLDEKHDSDNSAAYSLLNSYYVQMQYRKMAGNNSGLFIILNKKDLHCSSYELKYPEHSKEVFFFNFQMNPSSLGKISIEGHYNQNNIRVAFTAESDTKELLEININDLYSKLKERVKINPSITTNVSGHKAASNYFRLSAQRGVNVRA